MADLQQALTQLKDIRLPEPVSIWQIAPGWWLSVLIISVLLIVSYKLASSAFCKNRYRRIAVKQLETTCEQQSLNLDDQQLLSQINQLLKAVAIKAYPNHSCASLSGKHWQHFLSQTITKQKKASPEAFHLFDLLYQNNPSLDDVQRASLLYNARLWLKKHHPLSIVDVAVTKKERDTSIKVKNDV